MQQVNECPERHVSSDAQLITPCFKDETPESAKQNDDDVEAGRGAVSDFDEVTQFVAKPDDDLSAYHHEWLYTDQELEEMQSRRGQWDDGIIFVSIHQLINP